MFLKNTIKHVKQGLDCNEREEVVINWFSAWIQHQFGFINLWCNDQWAEKEMKYYGMIFLNNTQTIQKYEDWIVFYCKWLKLILVNFTFIYLIYLLIREIFLVFEHNYYFYSVTSFIISRMFWTISLAWGSISFILLIAFLNSIISLYCYNFWEILSRFSSLENI